jgi:DNA-binding transcriptional LysR family regulator
MNITLLNTLRTILEQGSFTAAAGVVGCSPSAVSLQVKQLESYFGKPLFDRSMRTMRPTPFAREVVGAVGDFSLVLERLRSRPTMEVVGKIRVGVITSMQSDALPVALRFLRERHPSLEVVIPPMNDSDELIGELKAGRLDVALVAKPRVGAARGLVWRVLKQQPYVLLVPAEADTDDAGLLVARYGWVGYDSLLPGGKVAARFVRALVGNARCSMELRSVDAIVSIVAEGLGVSVIPQPRPALLKAYAVREVSLGGKAPFRQLSLVCRGPDENNRNVLAVLEAFDNAFVLPGR